MDEEKETEKKTEEEPAKNNGSETSEDNDAGASEETSMIDKAIEVNKKKEELLDREEKLLTRKEKLETTRMLGGTMQAGKGIIEQKETDEEYAEKFRRGEVNPLEDDGARLD